jgi:uncharacterized protein YdaU (DUF1376 family)
VKPDAFLKFYGSDFFEAVNGYSDAVCAAYLRALWHYFKHSHCDGLPNDSDYLRRVCRCELQSWAAVGGIVFGRFFQLIDGKWHQERCREEYLTALEQYKRQVDRTAKARQSNPCNTVTAPVTAPVTGPVTAPVTDQQSESESESVQREREKAPDIAGGCPEIPPMSRKDFDQLCDMRNVPKDCADWFWNTHDARGWLDSRGQPIRKVEPLLLNALKSWQSNATRTKPTQPTQSTAKPGGAETVLRQKEYERVIETMRSIRNSYSEHQSWDSKDKRRYNQLVERKKELQKILGVTV